MKINLTKLNQSIASALAATTIEVAAAAEHAIEDERWDWDNETRRKNGEIVGTPRDIIDTGELRDSQVVKTEPTKGTISYTADHASIVHADRPFLKVALDESDIAKLFAKKLGDRL